MDPATILAFAQALEAVPIIGPYVLPTISGTLTLMGACAGASAHMPPPKKIRGVYYRGYHVINFVGGNYRYASNALTPVLTPVTKSEAKP